jgi:hypothetical protein
LQRLVLLELAAAVLLVGWAIAPMALVPAGVVAVALVLLAFVRRRGRSLPEWMGTARALRARQKSAANTETPPGTEPGLTPTVECDPTLRTYSYGGRDRRPIGLIGDGTFVTAVVQVEADVTALRADRNRQPLPLSLVRDALEVDGIRLESAQLVLHTQPAPALHLPQHSVAVTNYAPLQEQTGAPAVRITWIALKLDPEQCLEAVAARGGGLTGAQKCVVRVADHLASRLTGAGLPHDDPERGGADRRPRHLRLRQPPGDGGGRTDRHTGAPDRGVQPELALRQPQTHDVLDPPLAPTGRSRPVVAPADRPAHGHPGARHDVQPHARARVSARRCRCAGTCG